MRQGLDTLGGQPAAPEEANAGQFEIVFAAEGEVAAAAWKETKDTCEPIGVAGAGNEPELRFTDKGTTCDKGLTCGGATCDPGCHPTEFGCPKPHTRDDDC
jgi:hypothetical protein